MRVPPELLDSSLPRSTEGGSGLPPGGGETEVAERLRIIEEFALDLNEWRSRWLIQANAYLAAGLERAQLREFGPSSIHARAAGDPRLYHALVTIAGYLERAK